MIGFTYPERLIAFRYLKPRKGEGFLSIIAGFSLVGIALGVATLIIVMSVMNGFRAELLNRILGLNGHMVVYGVQSPLTDYGTLTERLQQLDGVTHAAPLVEGQVLANANGVSKGALVRGIQPQDFMSRTLLANNIKSGDLAAFQRGEGLIVGVELARQMGLAPGRPVTLLSPKGTASAFGTLPNARQFPVAAVFDVGMYEYDSSFIFMPLELSQAFFKKRGLVDGVELIFSDPNDVKDRRTEILVASERPVEVIDWQDRNQSFFNAIEVERNVMFLILTLIILVAAFNIISMLIILVKDKRANIAILQTMGASRRTILKIFLLNGTSIGLLGTFIGFALGVLFVQNIEAIRQALEALTGTELFSAEIYFLSKLPAKLDWTEVGSVLLMAIVITLLASLYPAWRASKSNPAEVLRYE